MITTKQRAELRGLANNLEDLFQIGKGGISDTVIAQVEEALIARELIKIKVLLETSPVTPREAAIELAEKTNSDIVQVIGGKIVLFRRNPKKPIIILKK
ncbi:MAG: YhbY family RNA-binding protein [Oscillospiraceae bacterium]|nr:YhbY family RNA-binding protein [Oscillospiraceae bacterium]MBR3920676.1 YhbY family RNA-binding protein [Oscillospiraceae bacterium]